ncbi:5-formyltetrahydrofolate cyclo-ligase [Neisseriaceae bacterium ESL0693]|nr:5-formyltetrahydrofolate cyclo-ligase [Neisseriaceae bacterium ESL0693]
MKHQERQLLRQKRQALTDVNRKYATDRCNRYLYRLIKRHRRIGVYWAVGSELSLWDFICTAQRRGAQIYLPYIEAGQQRLWFSSFSQSASGLSRPVTIDQHISCHQWGIPQFEGHKIRAHQLHYLVLPLIGVDLQGNRLGQGGGFYDVTLAHTHHRHRPRLIGAGFACQQTDQLFSEPHDYPLDAFVCETGWQTFHHD